LQALRARVARLDDPGVATAYWAAFAWVAGDRLAADLDYAHIVAHAEQGCRTLGLQRLLFRTLLARAWRCMRRADYATARAALAEAATLERTDWPAWLRSDRLTTEGAMHIGSGDVASAQRAFAASGALLPPAGERDRSIRATTNLGVCAGILRRWADSAALLQPLMDEAWRTHRHTSSTIWASGQLVIALTELGRLDEAQRLLVDQLPLWRADGILRLRLFAAIHLAVAQGRAADAMRLTGVQERMDGGSSTREPLETRIRDENRRRLEVLLPADEERERLRREGAALDEAAIVALCIARPPAPAANA
jgi:tetratricopeptide (TPR) repeat protein